MLKKTNGQFFYIGVLWLCLVAVAQASIINVTTIYDNVSDNQFVTVGSGISGKFDISSLLVGNTILGIRLDLYATDDGENSSSGSSTGSYYYVSTNSAGDRTYRRNSISYYTNAAESADVVFEGEYVTSLQSSYYTTGNVYSYRTSYTQQRCARWVLGICADTDIDRYWTYYYSNTSGYSGSMNFSGDLGQNVIASAMDGFLDFTISSTGGDFVFNSASITVTTQVVPIPASLGLFASGLFGLVRVARAKRWKRKLSIS